MDSCKDVATEIILVKLMITKKKQKQKTNKRHECEKGDLWEKGGKMARIGGR